MEKTTDHRQEWRGGPEIPEKLTEELVTTLIKEGPALLKQYLAMHGDWREITSHTNSTEAPQSAHSWEFTVCQCSVCQAAEKLVGHPTTPNG